MKRLPALLLIALLVLPGAWVARAQDQTPDPGDGAVAVDVPWGDFVVTLDAGEPLTACVIEKTTTPDVALVTVLVAVRHSIGAPTPLGVYETEAIGPLANAEVETCLGLAAVE